MDFFRILLHAGTCLQPGCENGIQIGTHTTRHLDDDIPSAVHAMIDNGIDFQWSGFYTRVV